VTDGGGPLGSGLDPDPRAVVEWLAGDERVLLIGVRHHSPVLAAAVPALLDAFRPETVLVELPAEMQPWVRWLSDPGTVAPVALAAAEADRAVAFYPFADFSPELVAVRWARRHDVPVICGDLPLTDPAWTAGRLPPEAAGLADTAPAFAGGPSLESAVHATISGRIGEDLWDRWVEAAAPGSSPEAVRRAALAAGWALRHDTARYAVDPLDLRREACMREHLRGAPGRVAAVIGAFHAPALIPPPGPVVLPEPSTSRGGPVISLVPYTFDLLDARSGYPAGIRDPRWQQAVFEGGADPARVRAAAGRFAVEVTRSLRAQGQPAGPGESAEVTRMAGDLAGLRGLPAPGRGELVEALQTVLAQGAPIGAGRTVARAMEEVLVGRQRGRLPDGAPVTGLRPAAEEEITRLKLPGPGRPNRRIRLDPLRSPTDRARELAIRRLTACGAPYGEPAQAGPVAGGETLTTTWRVEWTPATDAALALAGLHGVTLAQAAAGTLAARRRREQQAGGPTPDQALTGLEQAAACGLMELAGVRLSDVRQAVAHGGSVQQIIAALHLISRIDRGHIAGLPIPPATTGPAPATPPGPTGLAEPGTAPGLASAPDRFGGVADGDAEWRPEVLDGLAATRGVLHAAAVAAVAGLAGSTRIEDARALTDLVQAADEAGRRLRLGAAIRALVRDGSPLMAGAAGAVGVLLGHEEPEAFGRRLASWADRPDTGATDRLRGALSVAGALLQSGGEFLTPLLDTVDRMPDDDFVRRLPGLRGGFDVLSPADRDRLLRTVGERHGTIADRLPTDPLTLAGWIAADRAGLAALQAFGLTPDGTDPGPQNGSPQDDLARKSGGSPRDTSASPQDDTSRDTGGMNPGGPGGARQGISPAERWRLLLGREAEQLSAPQRRMATALDELYGAGQGEGAYTVGGGAGGGREAAYPEIRDWLADLDVLFGTAVRDEVLARAAERGRADAVLAADPERVRPSIELLHAVLSMAGGLPEARLARLRPLVARLTAELTAQLARRIRPALTGLGTPRPTRRPSGRLDLAATVRQNLHTVRADASGRPRIVPERPVFRSPGRRTVDWQVILLVDVSGSMEQSTIWAAMTASVLAGVPALRTHFVTFSTAVVDMTDRVADPLSLLLEIRVGGGTHIAAGLRYARQITVTPSRTLVITISDFEEGYPIADLLGAVRTLVDDGVTLLGCASLNDKGQPRYSTGIAAQLAGAGMPVAALSPSELAGWIGDQVR
jgi:Mg-chelatase subunit ChlD